MCEGLVVGAKSMVERRARSTATAASGVGGRARGKPKRPLSSKNFHSLHRYSNLQRSITNLEY